MKRKNQSGLTLIGVLFVGAILAAVLVVGLKLIPVFAEYFGIKRALTAVAEAANPQSVSVSELRSAFSKRAMVDDVTSVSATDIDITKENGRIVMSVEYSRKVPLVANVSLLIDFSVSSAGSR